MQKPSSSSSKAKTRMINDTTKRSERSEMGKLCFFGLMNEDILQNILRRLPAKSFAFASCVNRSWSGVCNRILSRPKLVSAFSLNPNRRRAAEEVLDKVLSEPIRPDFVIANITGDAHLEETLKSIVKKVGRRVPIVVSLVGGIIGSEASNGEFREEVKIGGYLDVQTLTPSVDANSAILLTIGYVPGLKVDVVPAIQSKEEPEVTTGDSFVVEVRKYVDSVSDLAAPLGIILFGDGECDMKPIIEKLDHAMPMETVILGDERGQFLYRSVHVTRKIRSYSEYWMERKFAAGLVFARDRNKPCHIGEIRFHTALSSGVSAIRLKYKAVSVKVDRICSNTFLTARREGQPDILDGQQILDDINDELENHIGSPNLYIGVTKRRRYAVGLEKPKLITFLAMHEVVVGDEQSLTVEGLGIRTGDHFQIYYSDPKAALTSVNDVSSRFQNLKTEWNSVGKKTEAFGGFIFSCCGRECSFFDQSNVDSSPFLENFPGLPFGGVFCGGEIGRGSARLSEEESRRGDTCLRQCLHVYSTVYLLMTYTSEA